MARVARGRAARQGGGTGRAARQIGVCGRPLDGSLRRGEVPPKLGGGDGGRGPAGRGAARGGRGVQRQITGGAGGGGRSGRDGAGGRCERRRQCAHTVHTSHVPSVSRNIIFTRTCSRWGKVSFPRAFDLRAIMCKSEPPANITSRRVYKPCRSPAPQGARSRALPLRRPAVRVACVTPSTIWGRAPKLCDTHRHPATNKTPARRQRAPASTRAGGGPARPIACSSGLALVQGDF
eukprot:6227871-Prymnesium_polylepis.1